jgi:hypothetical protein
MIDVHDIIIHTPTLDAQRIYRVTAIRLGGLKEEGVIELQPLGYSTEYPIRVPHMMLDDMVTAGVVIIGWRRPGKRPAHPSNAEDESCEGYRADHSHGETACLPNSFIGRPAAAQPLLDGVNDGGAKC